MPYRGTCTHHDASMAGQETRMKKANDELRGSACGPRGHGTKLRNGCTILDGMNVPYNARVYSSRTDDIPTR